ncbi:MAG: DUF6057 family protein [Bacteroidaceae bacterium]|nr:DUF6057 family protein [Bacteroidaceae bacterium]
MHDRLQQKRNNAIATILSILFLLFTAFYVIFFQCDLFALMQETWAHGQTTNNPYVTAVIVGLLLFLLHLGVKRITQLSGRWEAFTWLPSYLLLGLLTDVDSRTLHYDLIPWAAIMGGCLLVVLLACWLRSVWPSDLRTPVVSLLVPGLVVSVVSMVLCLTFTNHDAALHQELAAYRHASHDDAARVAAVGRRSQETTPALTALRNIALAREGRVGDELFCYPQPYGSDGLGVNPFTRQNTRFGASTFYAFLGAEPYGGEAPAAFVERLYRQDDTPLHRNLYAASLLLDGKLNDFVRNYPPTASGAPRHFREAWLLCRALRPSGSPLPPDYRDAELQPKLDDFLDTLRRSPRDRQETLNALSLTYGQTYWFYYAQHWL